MKNLYKNNIYMNKIIKKVYNKIKKSKGGKVASYIPELAKVRMLLSIIFVKERLLFLYKRLVVAIAP